MRTLLLSVLAAFALTGIAAAQSTAFTYQGRLKSGGEPATGLHDIRFRLFDAVAGGSQLGTTQCLNNVSVADGLFTAAIDFGQQFASPDERFLEIEVREDTGLGCGNGSGLVTLTPRQPLTAAPLASHAKSAFALDAADGGPINAVYVDEDGRVGIRTSAPATTLHVAAEEPVLVLQDTDAAATQVGYIGFWNDSRAETAWVGFGTPGSPAFSVFNARYAGNINLFPGSAGSGSVGIGTSSPLAKLDVRGEIRFGPDGAGVQAAGGVEHLRLLRGTINGNGTIIAGTGFMSVRQGEGAYEITFSTPFPAAPSVTAMAEWPGQGHNIRVAHFIQVTASLARIRILFADSELTDSDFSFCVIGPR